MTSPAQFFANIRTLANEPDPRKRLAPVLWPRIPLPRFPRVQTGTGGGGEALRDRDEGSGEVIARYVAIPRAGRISANGWEASTSEYAIEVDREPVATGLLDQHGVSLYRVAETVPFGFHPPLKSREIK